MSRRHCRFDPSRSAGVTLIELLVALVISMMLLLAIYQVLSFSEGRKRSTTSVNDVNEASTYSAAVLDNLIRSAGSGFAPIATYAYGCKISAARGGAAILPGATLPAPFASVNPTGTLGTFRLAPILIVPDATTPNISGQKSDVLIVMSGAAGLGNLPANVSLNPGTGATAVTLDNTYSYSSNDLVLVTDSTIATGGSIHDCAVEQVSSSFAGGTATSLPFAGTYAQALGSFDASTMVTSLGNVVNNNPPIMTLIGVGDNNTLYSYDLLQTSGVTTPSVLADSVFEIHAIYGVDSTGGGTVDSWYSPKVPSASTATYGTSALMAGTSTAQGLLSQIKAVRLGIIFRSSLQETSAADSNTPACTSVTASSPNQNGCVGPSKVVFFSGMTDKSANDISVTRSFTNAERIYRYRTAEFIIPVRNNLL